MSEVNFPGGGASSTGWMEDLLTTQGSEVITSCCGRFGMHVICRRCSLPSLDKVGYGGVVFSNNDEFLAAKSGRLQCIQQPYQDEAMACREVLSWIKDRGVNNVVRFV